jgi:FMN reductase (NADPH)
MRELLRVLREHTSVRDYTPEPVADDVWDELLSAGQQASTDATGQLYCAVEVRDVALRDRVGRWAGDQAHVHAAPRFLVVCLDVRRLRLLLEHRGERYGMRSHVALLFGITDAALFAQNVTVAAEALGLGVCYIGGVQNHVREIADELGLPQDVLPLWGLTVGRPAHKGHPKPRLPRAAVVHVDRYRDPTPALLDECYDVMKAATRSGDWLNPIRKYFAEGGVMAQREASLHETLASRGLDPCGDAAPRWTKR